MDYKRFNAALLIFSLYCCSSYGMSWFKKNIFDAAYDGDVARVQELLDSGTDVDTRGYKVFGFISAEDHPPLYHATLGKQIAVVQFLLSRHAQVNLRDYDGFTALHAAASSGAEDIARLLIKHGADVNAKTDSWYGLIELYRTNNSGLLTPLHLAARENIDVAQILIDNGARVHAIDGSGHTALYFAAQYGNIAAARLLIDHNADINAQDLNGNTPLHIAVLINNFEMVKFLVENWADISVKDNSGRMPSQLTLNPVIIQYLDSVAADRGRAEALARMRIRASLPHEAAAIVTQIAHRSSLSSQADTQDRKLADSIGDAEHVKSEEESMPGLTQRLPITATKLDS